MSDELLPCPFCGGKAKALPVKHPRHVICDRCCAEIRYFNVVARWNRRTQPTPPPNLTEHEARVWRYNQGEIK